MSGDERIRALLRRARETGDPLDVMAWRHAQGLESFVVGDVVKSGDRDVSGWEPTGTVTTIFSRPDGGQQALEFTRGVGAVQLTAVAGCTLVTPARCEECSGEAWAHCECQGTGWKWPLVRGACRVCETDPCSCVCEACAGKGWISDGHMRDKGSVSGDPCWRCQPCPSHGKIGCPVDDCPPRLHELAEDARYADEGGW